MHLRTRAVLRHINAQYWKHSMARIFTDVNLSKHRHSMISKVIFPVPLVLASVTTAAYLTSAFLGSITLGRLIGIPLTTRIRPRTMLLSSIVGALVGVCIILVWSDSTFPLWVGTMGTGLSKASPFPGTFKFAGRRLNITGRITGWFFIGVGAVSIAFPWIIGQVCETNGPQSMMVIIMIAILLTIASYKICTMFCGIDCLSCTNHPVLLFPSYAPLIILLDLSNSIG